ncbi:MAG: hypothetical protein RLZ35_412 [Pseudomonadota bacterium]
MNDKNKRKKETALSEDAGVVIAALYQFMDCPHYKKQAPDLKMQCKQHGIKGTLIFSSEGINGTVSGTRAGIDALRAYLINVLGFTALEYKESSFEKQPFYRMKVLVKPEIVTLGRPDILPHHQSGTYVSPKEWNALIQQEGVTVIDVRNDYEVKIGTFKGAVNPKTNTFKAFPAFTEKHLDPRQHKKIAMFCTGGIRCEKASAYMLKSGFEEVYHLKGGILQYLEDVPVEESLWEGECFVFDQRVAVKEQVKPGSYALCYGCRLPVSESDKASDQYIEGVCCPACHGNLSEEKRARATERHRQVQLATKKGENHIGASKH